MRRRRAWASSTAGLIAAAALASLSCSRAADREADRAALLRLHEVQRTAHLESDAGLLVSSFSDSFLSLRDGRVERPTRAESLRRFGSYLESVEILEWEDIDPPVIRISGDGTMAHVVVRKRVRLVPAGGGEEEHTVHAWLETWEKREGEWELTAVASTERPDRPAAEDSLPSAGDAVPADPAAGRPRS